MKEKLISVVIPCYNEDLCIQEIYRRVNAVFQEMVRYDFLLDLVFDRDSHPL